MREECIEFLTEGLDIITTMWAMVLICIGFFILGILCPIWALPYYLWKRKKE